MTNNDISVLVFSYNLGQYLQECVNSILNQTILPGEIILINDASTDATHEICNQLRKKYPLLIRYFRNKNNLGLVNNLNTYIPVTLGTYVCKIDADDYIEANYIETFYQSIEDDKNVAIYYSDLKIFGPRAKIIYDRFPDYFKNNSSSMDYLMIDFPEFTTESKRLLKKRNFIHSASIIQKEAFFEVNGFRDDPILPEDHDFFMRVIDVGYEAKKMQGTFLYYRQHSIDQLSQKQNVKQELLFKAKEVEQLKQQIILLNSDRQHIRQSLSYRIGFALTWPFRILISLLFRSRSNLLQIFNQDFLLKALTALRNEPFRAVLSNGFNKFKKNWKKNTSEFYSTPFSSLMVHLDSATLFDHNLSIRGWAISQNVPIQKIILRLDLKEYLIDIGQPRPDVAVAYPDFLQSANSGFSLNINTESSSRTASLEIITIDGFSVGKIIEFNTVQNAQGLSLDEQYAIFLDQNKLTSENISIIKRESKNFSYRPLISIITPVYNVEPRWLDKCIQSVLDQYYDNWELCLYDDCSTNQATIQCLQYWELRKEPRIKIKYGTKNLHISGSSNEALKMAKGDYIGLMDHDDEITPDALYEVVKAININPDLKFIYSDEDKIDIEGTLSEPHFKADFSPLLFRAYNYLSHFSVIKADLGAELFTFRSGYEGAQDYDLYLRIIDTIDHGHIYHIPRVLYHWRKIPGSTATTLDSKDYAYEAGKKALTDHLNRNNIKGKVTKALVAGAYNVSYDIDSSHKVSIIIPFKDQYQLLHKCIDSILSKTVYKNYEILLISNNTTDQKTLEYVAHITAKHEHIICYEYDIPFNYSAINNWAVNKASGEYILLLNNDTEVINKEWLSHMIELIQQPNTAAVGAKLLYNDKTLQHAGVIIGLGGVAGHSHKHLSHNDPGYFFRPQLVQNLSCCTAACLLIRKNIYNEVNGLEEKHLKVAFNDVDICLKIREKGYLIAYTPYAQLYHYESKSRGHEDTPEKQKRFDSEIQYFQNKWKKPLQKGDPYYNPNLTLDREDFSLNI